MYYATGGAHPPHTPPKEWLDVYKGKFDQGWDKLRGEILARQIKMGLMPPGTKIAENPPEIPKWDALSDDAKKVLSRQMEVYAGYAEHTDREIGRLIDAIGDLGELDNTIVIYIAGDNGGTAIGGLNGTFNEWSNLNDAPEDIPYLKTRMVEYGGPNSYPNYSVAWAMAGSTPATWCINACQGGGQNQGMVIRWPGGIKSKGEIRRQYTHLIDVGPTILEAVVETAEVECDRVGVLRVARQFVRPAIRIEKIELLAFYLNCHRVQGRFILVGHEKIDPGRLLD